MAAQTQWLRTKAIKARIDQKRGRKVELTLKRLGSVLDALFLRGCQKVDKPVLILSENFPLATS